MAGARRPAPIARSIFLLVLAAILLATLMTFAITYGGPPPFEPPVPKADVARALAGEGGRGVVRLLGPAAPRAAERFAAPAVDAALAARLGGEVRGYYAEPQRPGFTDVRGSFTIAWRTPAGALVAARTPDRPLVTSWHLAVAAAMLGMLALLSLPAWAIVRAISRPLGRLARSAREARVGRPLALPPDGSREVRELGEALAAMHERIGRHAEGRTAMLAAIAHDLGTPLSRLAFHVEALPEAARARAATDIDEMRAMIAAALAFARDELREGEHRRVELGSLLDSLADDMRAAGDDVTVEPGPRVVMLGDPAALRRLFANLFSNAVRYGERARVAWSLGRGEVVVTVEDDGPGIDPGQAECLFEPFVRGDPSRNRATGGTGLGLAIVRAIAARHGGGVSLENGERGARARVVLPC